MRKRHLSRCSTDFTTFKDAYVQHRIQSPTNNQSKYDITWLFHFPSKNNEADGGKIRMARLEPKMPVSYHQSISLALSSIMDILQLAFLSWRSIFRCPCAAKCMIFRTIATSVPRVSSPNSNKRQKTLPDAFFELIVAFNFDFIVLTVSVLAFAKYLILVGNDSISKCMAATPITNDNQEDVFLFPGIPHRAEILDFKEATIEYWPGISRSPRRQSTTWLLDIVGEAASHLTNFYLDCPICHSMRAGKSLALLFSGCAAELYAKGVQDNRQCCPFFLHWSRPKN